MTAKTARKISTNPEVLKRLAKYLAQQCFRNTMLEDLHAGITPNSQSGDYSDVFVQSPYGQIPWSGLSRLSDQEMKALMIDVVNKTYRALRVLFDDRLGAEVIKIIAARPCTSLGRAHHGLRYGALRGASRPFGFMRCSQMRIFIDQAAVD